MNNSNFDIKNGFIFPSHFLFMGYLLVFAGIVVTVEFNFGGIIVLIIGLLISTAANGTDIDLKNKKLREYNSVMGYKIGKFIPYSELTKLYINAVNTKQEIYTKVTTTSTIRYQVYNAYLRIDDHENILLASSKNKGKIIKRIEAFAKEAKLEVVDNTEG